MNKKYIMDCLRSLGECLVELGALAQKDLLSFDVLHGHINDAITYLQMVRHEIND